MNKVQEFYDATQNLLKLLEQEIPSAKRDETIDEVNHLIEKREQLLSKITPPYTEEEQKLGKELIALNKQVDQKLDKLFNQVKQDMRTVKKQKSSNTKYTNPYKNLPSFDGVYLDHKK